MMADELLTVDELADVLRLHRRTIDRRRVSGRLGIPEFNIGGDRNVPGERPLPRFRLADVENYLKNRRIK